HNNTSNHRNLLGKVPLGAKTHFAIGVVAAHVVHSQPKLVVYFRHAAVPGCHDAGVVVRIAWIGTSGQCTLGAVISTGRETADHRKGLADQTVGYILTSRDDRFIIGSQVVSTHGKSRQSLDAKSIFWCPQFGIEVERSPVSR